MNGLLQPTLIVGMAGAFLWVFITIAIDGRYFYEPIVAILAVEIVMVSVIFVYGIVRFVQALRRL